MGDDEERTRLEAAIAALEAQRAILGDLAVDAAVEGLRQKLAAMGDNEEAERSQHSQQRKHVTVLFAAVQGYRLSGGLDVEDEAALLNTIWRRFDGLIQENGGQIDKHISHKLMALWGRVQAREDDPSRAVRAALALQAEVERIIQEEPAFHQRPLSIRTGLHTGPVLLGRVGANQELTAMGDTVNLAARLQSAAPPGGILISHTTYILVRGGFDVSPQPPLQLKGKARPVQAYLVRQARPRSFSQTGRGIEGIATRMVGREAELLVLQNAYRDAAGRLDDDDETLAALDESGGETRLVVITGEAGVGKTRLLAEFAAWVERQPELPLIFRSRALPEGERIPFNLIRVLFSEGFGILESDPPALAMEKFRKGMSPAVEPDQADLAGYMIGFDFAASPGVLNLLQQSSSRHFAQLARMYLTQYLRYASQKPVLFLLEDLHWADDSSLDLISHWTREIPDGRLLIVCTARPALYERRPHWGEACELCTRLTLDALPRRISRLLVDEILKNASGVSTGLRDRIVASTEGSPYYIEELIRTYMEQGVIDRSQEPWQVHLEKLNELQVPATLIGILQARLDRLPPEERLVLQAAAVIGPRFWDGAVCSLLDQEELMDPGVPFIPIEKIGDLLEELRRRDLISRREKSVIAGVNEFVFKNTVMHNVTYETVLLKQRGRLHRQAALWLEKNLGRRLAESLTLIAMHFERAGENAQAAQYLERSGQELYRTNNYVNAITAFERACALLTDDSPKKASLLVQLGDAAYEISDYSAASDHYTAAHGVAQQQSMAAELAAAQVGQARVFHRQGRHTEAKDLFNVSLEIYRRLEDKMGIAGCLLGLGQVAWGVSDYPAALARFEESLALYRELGDLNGIAICLYSLGSYIIVSQLEDNYDRAIAYLQESMAMCQRTGNRVMMADNLNTLAYIDRLSGDFERASEQLMQANELYQQVGSRWGYASTLNGLGNILWLKGNAAAAERYLNDSLVECQAIGDRWGIAVCYKGLGHCAVMTNQLEKARRWFDLALAESMDIRLLLVALGALAGYARLFARQGELERAAELTGLLLHHSSSAGEHVQEVEPALALLRSALSPAEIEAAQQRGRALDLTEVAQSLLKPPEK